MKTISLNEPYYNEFMEFCEIDSLVERLGLVYGKTFQDNDPKHVPDMTIKSFINYNVLKREAIDQAIT